MTLTELLSNRNTKFTFTDYNGSSKEEYIEWVKNWKVEYNNISNEIRFWKERRKSTVYGNNISVLAHNRCRDLSYRATDAIEKRVESKLEAAKQYKANMEVIS